tara:strand:+ start:638 stop:2344 length:1707 start_codon:yes stop_codon:yes gene_type:complete
MIRFKTLTFSNFLSTGDQPTTIHLDSHKTTLVVGTNGAGKSTMLDALSFALFGKPHRNINKPQLINSINGKKCLVEVTFSIGTSEYGVVRGIKPTKFEIWKDGEMLNQESHARDYQKVLETNILKLNHKSFHQIVVLGSSNFIPFMQLPAHHRREVIEDLLDIGIFTKMNTVLKDKLLTIKNEINYVKTQIGIAEEKIGLQKNHINKIKSIDDTQKNEIQTEIEELNEQNKQLREINEDLTEQLSTDVTQDDVQSIRAKQSELSKFEGKLEQKVSRYKGERQFFTDNQSCPTCGQDISKELKDETTQKIHEKLFELEEGNTVLQKEMSKTNAEFERVQSELVRVRNIAQDISTNTGTINQNQSRITGLNIKLTQENDTTEDEAKLNELYEALNENTNKSAEYSEGLSYCNTLESLLKDGGIKAKVIKQYLPVMNKLINQYLQVLDFFVLFNIDENFSETIRSRHRDDFSYSSFSEGEKSRIDLALMFTWRQIARMKNSTSTNLLMLDETFDSSLDGDGVENLLKILGTLDADSNTFIISHKTDVLDGKFANKLTFEKVNNFSKMTQSS